MDSDRPGLPPLIPMPSAIHLDTNYLIYYAGGGDAHVIASVDQWLLEGRALHISAMAWAEFQCGPLTPEENEIARDLIHSVVPVTVEMATEAGQLFQKTGRRSRSLPDCIIAATALRDGASVASVNKDDFKPFLAHGLTLI